PDLHLAGLRDCGTGQRGPVRRGRVLRSWQNPRRGFVRPVPARASPEARGRSPRPPPLLAGPLTRDLRGGRHVATGRLPGHRHRRGSRRLRPDVPAGATPPGLTVENIKRIRPGMDRELVERMLGGPQRMLGGPPRNAWKVTRTGQGEPSVLLLLNWRGP